MHTRSGWKNVLKRMIYSLGSLCQISPKDHLEGMAVCRMLHTLSISTTLGKISKSGDDPLAIVREHQLVSHAFSGILSGDCFHLSLKPPAVAFSLEHASTIAATAFGNGHGIHLDSHGHADVDLSLEMLYRLLKMRDAAFCSRGGDRVGLGFTLPSRWQRSAADAALIAGKGVRVRIVKGEFNAPAYGEIEPAAGFLQLVDSLAGRVPEIAVATHDRALAEESVARCRQEGATVVIELLFGMPAREMMRLARKMKIPVRFYVPYGENLLIYGFGHYLKNPHKLLRRNVLDLFASQSSKLHRIAASI